MSKITKSSTAEYFAKNLQQVGFSSPLKAVLTTLKEAVDNSLDACEQAGILPELKVEITRKGTGSTKNTDLIYVAVEDNGPGIDPDDLAKVFGEYLASSKFGKGQCSRGQQGIGISAATTWAQLTNAKGAIVTTKTENMRKAVSGQVDVDIKTNTGILRKKETIDWDKKSGTRVEFELDGRIQLNGDGGLITYLEGTVLVNPHLTLDYKLVDNDWVHVDRVTTTVPEVPEAALPHPHTFKLGEFITHSHLYGKVSLEKFLKTGFSRVSDQAIGEFKKKGLQKSLLDKPLTALKDEDFKKVFQIVQETELMSPSTKSVINVGEEALSKSIGRLGEIDFFSVVTRKPAIADFKPVAVEVALARFKNRNLEADAPVQLLRFANRVPLQFDKSGCAITWAIESVNWKTYGLVQPKESLPIGPYVFAVSVVSPFIKFKNASKETIDASEELVEEIRRALIQAGQKLSRHIRKETKEADLERKLAHIEQFGPILVDSLINITKSKADRRKKAEEGLMKLLGRDTKDAAEELDHANSRLMDMHARDAKKRGEDPASLPPGEPPESVVATDSKGQGQLFGEAPPAKKSKKGGGAASKSKYGILMSKLVAVRELNIDIPKEARILAERMLSDLEKSKRPVLEAVKTSLDNSFYNPKVGYLTPGDKVVRTELNVSSVQKLARVVFILEILLSNLEVQAINTKREIYYICKGLIKKNPRTKPLDFEDQDESDSIIDFIGDMLQVYREELNCFANDRGGQTYSQQLVVTETLMDGTKATIDLSTLGTSPYQPKNKPQALKLKVKKKVDFALVVESEGTANTLQTNGFTKRNNAILIGAGGVPSNGTRGWCKLIQEELDIPIYFFGDLDAYTMQNIYRTLKAGSAASLIRNQHFSAPSVKFLGVLPEDVKKYDLPYYKVKESDPAEARALKKAKDALEGDPFFLDKKNKGLADILRWLMKEKIRCEQQSLFSVDPKDKLMMEKIILEKIKKGSYV